jgi:hypothetical protein
MSGELSDPLVDLPKQRLVLCFPRNLRHFDPSPLLAYVKSNTKRPTGLGSSI